MGFSYIHIFIATVYEFIFYYSAVYRSTLVIFLCMHLIILTI